MRDFLRDRPAALHGGPVLGVRRRRRWRAARRAARRAEETAERRHRETLAAIQQQQPPPLPPQPFPCRTHRVYGCTICLPPGPLRPGIPQQRRR